MPTLTEWRRFFDGWAGRDPTLASTGAMVAEDAFVRLGRQIGDWLALTGREHALDVGCASGTLTSQWADRAAAVTAVDFSQRLVHDAERRHANDRLRFVCAEAARLPFADHAFDRVVAFNLLNSLPDHAYVGAALAEIERVAKPVARVLLGSLPDIGLHERFCALLQQNAAWPRRLRSKVVRWLRGPASSPRTRMLWFRISELADALRARGWTVTVHRDAPFTDYHHYRKTLLLQRGVDGGHG